MNTTKPKKNKLQMDINTAFTEAVAISKTLPQKPDNETLLKIYSLYKQATEGDNTSEGPTNMFDFVAAAKHNAWAQITGMPKETAMQNYVDLINSLQ
jgi:diazepam-binding inhibitor (GABA receptor modulator, acyl-CoA-binding protein)